MGLTTSLSNAISGMNVSQGSLDVLSRNVANAGTPGYHRQSYNVVDNYGVNSTSAASAGIERAFNQSLQTYYTRSVSDTGFSNVRADMLDRLQTFIGKPGAAGGIDSMFASLQNALQQLSTSPDNYATRATVVSRAQDMATTLNSLTRQVQGLRQEAEVRISADVDSLNQSVAALGKINARLADQTADPASRASLLDQRDRLVSQISQVIDVRADYRDDGSVALMTRSGVGILDNKASRFEFQSAGALSAEKQFSTDPNKSGVGRLVLTTPSGLQIDLVQQNVLKSGELAGLVDLRDRMLPDAQSQLDTIAAGLAQAFSTVTTQGTAASSGAAQGLQVDTAALQDGNDLLLKYTQNGAEKSLRVMLVSDTSKLPVDYVDANGTRVVGVDTAGGPAAIVAAMQSALGPSFSVSNPSGSTIQVLDDGAADTTSVGALAARSTATGLQTGDLGFNLFVDRGNAAYTGSVGGNGQKLGFAGRIAVNSAVVSDNTLLVRYQAGGTLGDSARADYVLSQLDDMRFATGQGSDGGFRLGGTVSDLIAQTMDRQGSVAASALSDKDTQQLTMDALNQRMDSEYSVNVDEEMARLMQLQNAYAANARVISVVQDLLNRLMEV